MGVVKAVINFRYSIKQCELLSSIPARHLLLNSSYSKALVLCGFHGQTNQFPSVLCAEFMCSLDYSVSVKRVPVPHRVIVSSYYSGMLDLRSVSRKFLLGHIV